MRRVLIISYYFPPDGGAGTQRSAKFCKHLPNFGWEPVVLTRASVRKRTEWEPEDQTLLSDIASTEVVRVAVPTSSSSWAADLPRIDCANAWLEPAFERAKEMVCQRNIDVVLVTMSPFDLSFVGRRLQEALAIPVVYDLRDPWALDGWRIYSRKQQWKIDFEVMRDTLCSADGIVANTTEASKAIVAAIPDLPPDNICTIPNGFDREDFESTAPDPADVPIDDGNFYLIHTGTFHSHWLYKYRGLLGLLKKFRHYRPEPIQADGRTPLYLLRAAALLRTAGHPLSDRLRIVLVGQADAATNRCINESGMARIVRCTGYVQHATSIAWLRRADALFLPLHGLPIGRRSLIVPGKVYEYLAAERPILACLPDGDARDLVSSSMYGWCAPPREPEEIAQALANIYETAKQPSPDPDRPALMQYERYQLTGKLARFLDVTIQKKCRSSQPATLRSGLHAERETSGVAES